MKKKPWKRLSQSDSEAVMRLVDEYQSSIKRIIVSVLKDNGQMQWMIYFKIHMRRYADSSI